MTKSEFLLTILFEKFSEFSSDLLFESNIWLFIEDEDVEEDDSSAVLCRTNMSCLLEAFTIVESNEGLEKESKRKFHLDGGADAEMMQRIEDVVNLHNGDLDKISWSSEISGLKTFTEFKEELEDEVSLDGWTLLVINCFSNSFFSS